MDERTTNPLDYAPPRQPLWGKREVAQILSTAFGVSLLAVGWVCLVAIILIAIAFFCFVWS